MDETQSFHNSPPRQVVRDLCASFEDALRSGDKPSIEEWLGDLSGEERNLALKLLLAIELQYRRESGTELSPQEYLARFPSDEPLVEVAFSLLTRVGDTDRQRETNDQGTPPTSRAELTPPPLQVGRYSVVDRLGQGAFGEVMKARDDQLDRFVAIKVPHRHRVASTKDLEAFRHEARLLASLRYPAIVPVYDFGETNDGRVYVVYAFIDGVNLETRLKAAPYSYHESAQLIATIAEALHHAHLAGIVHRDVKPANILLDVHERPLLADFGLALHEEQQSKRVGEVSGTPAYMAPEQVLGAAHHLDGRADIWALGVILYEMLTRRRPFSGEDRYQLFEEILHRDPRPPRMIDDTIPEELERICLRALRKSPSERYTIALDMARDLRAFAGSQTDRQRDDDALLHAMWTVLDPALQDAFSIAYNKKKRAGSNRISTRDLFQALSLIDDKPLQSIFQALPPESLPEPPPAPVSSEQVLLREKPLLSDCVYDSLQTFQQSSRLPRRVAAADLFVDIAKFGHGPSVARLREHGVDAHRIDDVVSARGLTVLRREDLNQESPAEPHGEFGFAVDENVQFTVYRPRELRRKKWSTMLVFAHLADRPDDADESEPDPLGEVKRQAEQELGKDFGSAVSITQDSEAAIPRGSEVSLVPEAPGCHFNPRSRSFIWREPVHRETFRVRPSQETEAGTVRGRLNVFLGPVLIAEVALTFRVAQRGQADVDEGLAKSASRRFRKVYAAFAKHDLPVVAQCEAIANALGDSFFKRCTDLRRGDDWRAALRELIQEADVFQLFWSTSSMRSPMVRQEWEYALSLARPDFVRPVFWERPFPEDTDSDLPPMDLRDIGFVRLPFDSPRKPTRDTEPSSEGVESVYLCPTPDAVARMRGAGGIRGTMAAGASDFDRNAVRDVRPRHQTPPRDTRVASRDRGFSRMAWLAATLALIALLVWWISKFL